MATVLTEDEAGRIAANIAKLPEPSEDLCSVGNIGQKTITRPNARAGKTIVRPRSLANPSEYGEDVQVSTPELIRMLIICAAMLTIELLAYFAYQPVPL